MDKRIYYKTFHLDSRAMTQASKGTAETTKTGAGRRSVKPRNTRAGCGPTLNHTKLPQ